MSIVTLNDRGVRSVTTFGSLNTGSMIFIKKLTASSSSDLSFVNGTSDVVLDSTYKEYVFTFKSIHPSANGPYFQVNFRDGGSSYDATKTTTMFSARHDEDGSNALLAYKDSNDLAQGTGNQYLDGFGINNDNDSCISGTLHLFNPSSTTFVKHYLATSNANEDGDASKQYLCAGYFNTTSAIDAVQFKFGSGNIDAGTIKLYGIKDS